MIYLDWKFDWQIIEHDVDVNFNDERVKRHLAAVMRGWGSSSENIVIDFVLDQIGKLKEYRSLQVAWNRLDEEQQELVLAFRNLLEKPILGPKEHFPHLFYVQQVHFKYLDLLAKFEADIDHEMTIEELRALANRAKKFVAREVHTEDISLLWSETYDEAEEVL